MNCEVANQEKLHFIAKDILKQDRSIHRTRCTTQRRLFPRWNTVVGVLCCGDASMCLEMGISSSRQVLLRFWTKTSSIQQQHWVWVVPRSSNRTITQNIHHSWWRTASWRPKWKLLTGLSKPWLEPPWKSIVRSGGTGEICQRKKGLCCIGDICETATKTAKKKYTWILASEGLIILTLLVFVT